MKRAILLAFLLFTSGTLLAARPVARWDVIPHQLAEGVFKVGVVTFHETGVDVLFTVNGKKVWKAKRATMNERTGVVEYVYPFDASKHPDGPVTIGATVTAGDGGKYDLPDLPLYANSNKTLGSKKIVWVDAANGNEFADGSKETPVKTIAVGVRKAGDGGVVYLLPGTYDMKLIGGGKNRLYWTTVRPAPGVKREQVRVEGGRSGTEKLRFQNLDLFSNVEPGENRGLAIGEGGGTMAWFDNCVMHNLKGRTSGISKPFANKLRAFVTGGVTTEMTFGPGAEIVRAHRIDKISGEAFTGGNLLAVNVKVNDIDPAGSEIVEADLYQGFAQRPHWTGDVILYGIEATECRCRGIVGRQLRDAAFVDIKFQNLGNALCVTRFSQGLENVLFARLDMVDQAWEWMRQDSGRENVWPRNVRLYDVKASKFTGYDTTDGSEGLLVEAKCDWLPAK